MSTIRNIIANAQNVIGLRNARQQVAQAQTPQAKTAAINVFINPIWNNANQLPQALREALEDTNDGDINKAKNILFEKISQINKDKQEKILSEQLDSKAKDLASTHIVKLRKARRLLNAQAKDARKARIINVFINPIWNDVNQLPQALRDALEDANAGDTNKVKKVLFEKIAEKWEKETTGKILEVIESTLKQYMQGIKVELEKMKRRVWEDLSGKNERRFINQALGVR